MSYSLVKLGEIVDFVGGGTPSRDIESYWNGGIPWASVKDFKGQSIDDTKERISPEGLANSSSTVIPAGHVIIPTRMALGKAAINSVDIAINQDLKALIPKTALSERYLMHALLARSGEIQSLGKGATVKGVTIDRLSSLEIPLPPLEEQRRIAAILDKVQETLSLRRSCLQDWTASLELNLFLDLFGSPATNSKGWELVQIGDLAEIFSDGPFGSNLKSSHYTESGVRVIRLQNIGVREFVDNDKAFISISHYEELSKHTCLPGDILIGTLGDPNLRACIQLNHVPIAINKADCVQMRCAESVAHPLFVMHLLNTPDANAMASSLVLGQTRGRISMGRLRGLSIPVPPVELQAEFASLVEKIECLKQSLRLSFAEADRLKGALSHSLFRKS